MKHNAYSVQDTKANRYNKPYFMQSNVDAMRVFQQNCQDEKTLWHTYPDDYRLMLIGEFCEETARMTTLEIPQMLASARDYVPHTPIPVPAEK